MSLRSSPLGPTSGGVLAGGVPSEVLDEALDGEGLTDSFEFLSGSVAPLPFTWEHTQPPFNGIVNGKYQESPHGGSRGIYFKLFSLLVSSHFTFHCASKVYLTPQTSTVLHSQAFKNNLSLTPHILPSQSTF